MNSDPNIWYVLDFETSDTNPYTCEVAGIGGGTFDISTGKILDQNYFIPSDGLLPLFEHYPVVAHNAPFELHIAQRIGLKINGPLHCSLLMAKHVNNLLPAYDLKSLAWYYEGEPYLELLALKNWFRENGYPSNESEYMNMTLPPVPLVERYCLKDLAKTVNLAHVFWKGLKDSYAYELDRKAIPHTVAIEQRGMASDLKFYQEYQRLGTRRAKYNKSKAAERMDTDRNPMGDALRDHLGKLGETRRTKKAKKIQADDVVLRDWRKRDKAVGSVQRVRKDSKNISTYVKNVLAASVPLSKWGAHEKHIPSVGIFHPNFIQSGAVTRRYRAAGLYSSNGIKVKGNVQNFPPEMREGIIARPGYEFWKFDLASIEARIFSSFMELLMGESVFADMYRKDAKFNPYLWVIEQCTTHGKVTKKHELYIPYKHGVLGRLYCSGPKRFATQLRDKFELDYTEAACQAIYRSIDKSCPFIKNFQRYLLGLADDQGFLLDPFGAIYYQPSHKPYEIIAHLHQGAATMVLRWWMNNMLPMMAKVDDHAVCIVHDEIDSELRKGNRPATRAKAYCDVLKKLDIFDLPIRAEATRGKNWKECG